MNGFSPQRAEATLRFLARVQLAATEAPEFVEIVKDLQAIASASEAKPVSSATAKK